jgi:hypothetical protein
MFEKAMLWGLVGSNVGLLVATVVVIVGLVGEYTTPHHPRRIKFGPLSLGIYPWLVVIGVVGELVFDGLIFGTSFTLDMLNSAAVAKAGQAAAIAISSAGTANDAAKKANDTANKAVELATNLSKLNDAFEKKYGPLFIDRGVGDDQRRIIRNGINGHGKPYEVVRLDEREPRAYAQAIADALTSAHFTVRMTDFGHSSPLTGVIVCQNASADIELFRVLKEAVIATELKHVGKSDSSDRPAECPDTFPLPSSDPASRIFVGQRPAPK